MTKEEQWQKSFKQASQELSEWRASHQQASFSEVGKQLDKKLAQVRAEMLTDLAMESELSDFKSLPQEQRPKCPVCREVLASNGKQKRQLITNHEEVVELERSKGYSSHCRVSYFPPG